MRRGVGDVQARDPSDRRLQVVEALLGQPRGHLGPVPGEALRLVDDHGAPGAAHRLGQRRLIKGRQRAQVDHLNVPSLAGGGLGRLQGGDHHPAVGDEGDVPAGTPDKGRL